MWCECGVLCPTMSRPGPWLRFGRDAGAGAKLSPVSPLVVSQNEINRCMPYMCHICAHVYIYYEHIYDHIYKSLMMFFASDANWNFRNSIGFESLLRFSMLLQGMGPGPWPRALLSLQRRSLRGRFFSLVKKFQCKTYKIGKVSYQNHARTWEDWQCPMLPSCHCSLACFCCTKLCFFDSSFRSRDLTGALARASQGFSGGFVVLLVMFFVTWLPYVAILFVR